MSYFAYFVFQFCFENSFRAFFNLKFWLILARIFSHCDFLLSTCCNFFCKYIIDLIFGFKFSVCNGLLVIQKNVFIYMSCSFKNRSWHCFQCRIFIFQQVTCGGVIIFFRFLRWEVIFIWGNDEKKIMRKYSYLKRNYWNKHEIMSIFVNTMKL